MRREYSAQAVSAHAGSLALTATTWSLATGFGLRGLALGGFRHRRLWFRLRSLHLHAFAAPDLLQVVEAAHRRMHHVHHHVAEIDQDPLARRGALDAVDALAERLELVPHVVRKRLHLARGVAARDDHALEHGGQG